LLAIIALVVIIALMGYAFLVRTVQPYSGEIEIADPLELDLLENREEPVDEPRDQTDESVADAGLETAGPAAGRNAGFFSATARFRAKGVRPAGPLSIPARIGRLAPVLCLIAMSVAAGGYVLLNRLALTNLNDDLDDLSARVRVDSVAGAGTGGWRDLPVTNVSVVKQIGAENVGIVAPQQAGKPVNSVHPADAVRRPDVLHPDTDQAAAARQVEVTHNTSVEVKDEAYASVLAAFDAYRDKDYGLAETQYLQALKIEPHHADALAGLAAVYQQTGRAERAADTYRLLLGFDPGNTLAAAALISLRSSDANWDTESELKHLLQRFPETHHLHFALGTYFVEQGRWADARHEFLAAHQLAPRYADYSFNVAVSMERLGEYGAARDYYETALATAADSSNIDREAVTEHITELTAQLREPS
jgi:Tfp pilus assembly protein PilF